MSKDLIYRSLSILFLLLVANLNYAMMQNKLLLHRVIKKQNYFIAIKRNLTKSQVNAFKIFKLEPSVIPIIKLNAIYKYFIDQYYATKGNINFENEAAARFEKISLAFEEILAFQFEVALSKPNNYSALLKDQLTSSELRDLEIIRCLLLDEYFIWQKDLINKKKKDE